MDEVLCSTVKPWLKLYNDDYSDCVKFNDLVEFNLHKFTKKCNLKQLQYYISQPGFFKNLKPINDSIKCVKQLFEKGHDIIIATSTPQYSVTGWYDKQQWLLKWLSFLPVDNFVSIKRKDLIYADIIFDDAIHNVEHFKGIGVLMTRPWNKDFDADFRVNNWKEFVKLIEDIDSRYRF